MSTEAGAFPHRDSQKDSQAGNKGEFRRVFKVALLTVALWTAVAPPAFGQDPLVTGAGDISCDPVSSYFNGGSGRGSGTGTSAYCKQLATSKLLSDANVVFTLGDNQYEHGTWSKFRASYDKSWGRYKSKTRPAIGNHEYGPTASCEPTSCPPAYYNGGDEDGWGEEGYFDYFNGDDVPNGPAGPRPTRPANKGPSQHGYYSYNVGTWHLIALNSMCWAVGGCGAGSPQEKWLREDLAANRDKKCVLAYWHHPPFSSGQSGGYSTLYDPFWQALHDYRADVVLVGHDHVYERFSPQSASGSATSTGPRQFMVGTGGKNVGRFPYVRRNSAKRIQSHGVLRLRLMSGSYRWAYVRIGDGASLDSATASCVAGADTTPPAAPTNLSASAGDGMVALDWANNSEGDLAGYNVYRKTPEGSYTKLNGSLVSPSGYTDSTATNGTAYNYVVKAVDKTSNEGPASNDVSATPTATPTATQALGYRDTVMGTPGLISYWRLGETSGTTAADEKNARPGTYTGGVSLGQPGALKSDANTAGRFDGTNDEMTAGGSDLALTGTGTVEGWFNWEAGTSLLRDSTTSGGWILAYDNSGSLAYRVGGQSFTTTRTTASLKNGWHHLALTVSGGTARLYVDGTLVHEGSGAGTTAASMPWHLMRNGTYSQWTRGGADELAVYGSALSATTISQHYQAGAR